VGARGVSIGGVGWGEGGGVGWGGVGVEWGSVQGAGPPKITRAKTV